MTIQRRRTIQRRVTPAIVLMWTMLLGAVFFHAHFAHAQQGPQTWGEDWDGDGKDDHFFTDEDRDGNPEVMWVDTDEDGTRDEGWSDPTDDGDWDSKMENDGDNKRANGRPDWDRMKVDGDGDHDFDFVVTDSDDDGDLTDETPTDLDPDEAIPPNRPMENGADRNNGCVGPGCPLPSELGACQLGSGSCLDGTDNVMCGAIGTYAGDGTVCTTAIAAPAFPAWGPIALLLLLLAIGGVALTRGSIPRERV